MILTIFSRSQWSPKYEKQGQQAQLLTDSLQISHVCSKRYSQDCVTWLIFQGHNLWTYMENKTICPYSSDDGPILFPGVYKKIFVWNERPMFTIYKNIFFTFKYATQIFFVAILKWKPLDFTLSFGAWKKIKVLPLRITSYGRFS